MDAQIIPSILAQNKEELEILIKTAESIGGVAQVDICDGIFVPTKTIGPEEIDVLQTGLDLQIHLMVSKPENHIYRWLETPHQHADGGQATVTGFVIHIESTDKVIEIIDAVHETDAEVALCLNPETPISKIEPYIGQIDFVQFMTVKPGFYGAKFEESVLEKIKEFHYLYPDMPIQVDGGVNDQTIAKLKEAGASRFVVGSFLMKSQNPSEALQKLS